MKYNWQQPDWPQFHYKIKDLQRVLFLFAEKSGRMSGILTALPETLQTETLIDLMVAEAIKTSAIEGENINRDDVMSSIRNKFGLNQLKPVKDLRALGISQLMFDVRNTFQKPLNEKKLFEWHKMLFPKQLTSRDIPVGKWRTHAEPMQIISGPVGHTKIHFEAPPSHTVPNEMKQFIQWFNQSAPGESNEIPIPLVRTAIAHLYFETIHPFEDGNGRIGRAIAEKALSQGLHRPILFSLSQEIEANKKKYYDALKNAQKSNEISAWIYYFVHTALAAQENAEKQIIFILQKTKFLDRYKFAMNNRELKVIMRMLDAGPKGFMGGISAKKYIALTSTSKATATRDLLHLYELGALKKMGSGRSTHYKINFDTITL